MDLFEKLKILTDAAKYDVGLYLKRRGTGRRRRGRSEALRPVEFATALPVTGAVFPC